MGKSSSTDVPAARTWRAPEIVCAIAAGLARAIALTGQWRGNPGVRTPSLDAAYYLDWAREIAAGEWLTAGPVGAAEPYLLNPLYAWGIAPLTVFGDGFQLAVLVLQIVLGAATAGLAAAAARRWASSRAGTMHGNAASWVAGGAVACSAALVHLSTHVSVTTLAAFLIAGALFACSGDGPLRRGHGGIAAGLWLGVGALARPVTLLALPFVAWQQRRRFGTAAAVLTVAAFAACACFSLARNVAASGEPVVFTAANGLNLHLGQNPLGRETRSMLTDEFHFDPVAMHVDARHRVGLALGHEPSASETSAWYRDAALGEYRDHTADALAFTLQKARWFISPAEPPSSADMELDVERVPALRVGFLPTWLLVVVGLTGAWAARRNRGLLIVAGGLVVAHAAACTLSFPLSHYRAPAIPALAVLAGVGLPALLAAAHKERVITGAVAAVLCVIAWAPPQPQRVEAVRELNAAVDAIRAGDGPTALRLADSAVRAAPAWSAPLRVRADALLVLRRLDDALAALDAKIERTPWDVPARRTRAELFVDLGRPEDAQAAADALVEDFPWSAHARGVRGAIRAWTGDLEGAREDLRWASDRGVEPSQRVLQLTRPLDR